MKLPPRRTRIVNEEHFFELFRTKNEETDAQSHAPNADTAAAPVLTKDKNKSMTTQMQLGGKISETATKLAGGVLDVLSSLGMGAASSMRGKTTQKMNPFGSVEHLPTA